MEREGRVYVDLEAPSNYVGSLSTKVQDGKLRGLKTCKFGVLLHQVLPMCLRSVGNAKVVGPVIRVSRLFQNKRKKEKKVQKWWM
jgi:hypothetical protein